MTPERPKVVYVMGAGRSGSTILGITLGNCANIFYAGELNLWLARRGKSPLPGAERARFWDGVRAHVSTDLFGRGARSLEKSLDLLRVDSWRAQRRLRGPYRRAAEDLYRAIADEADATHVVDSSHFPRRARELQALDGIDLRLLFLVRKPQHVVASYSGDDVVFPRFNALNTNAYLWFTYVLSLLVFLRHPRGRRLLVRYEAFLANPAGVLQDILDCIDSPAVIPDLTALSTGMAFQGNRVLRSDVVALKGQPPKPLRGSRLTAFVHLPWTAIFRRLNASQAPKTPASRLNVMDDAKART
ncbi:MAG TPA: sulfotransferase [Solirubrobacteraceae bacterium]|nr:sulfotransferase [Solirubrobacteraceae bacterium]